MNTVVANERPRVLIVGCGGLGGIVSAALRELGGDTLGEVVSLSSNEAIAQAVNQHGFRITGADGERTIPGRVVTDLQGNTPPFDWVILATQPPQVEDAARRVLPFLSPTGAMVCLQNGLCEQRVARIAGDERVVGAVVAWGAAMPEPGLYERTSAGGFTLGRIDGADDPRLGQLGALLESVGPVNITRNLAGARWSKLAINCAISTLGTLSGMRLGALLMHRSARRLALEIMTEAVAVARAEGVKLEKVSGTLDLDWIALTEGERRSGGPGLVAKHAMLLAVGARYRRMRSSMLSAIERGRTPAVDYLNGEVVAFGTPHGVDTPVNAEATRLVHALARREFSPSIEVLSRLADVARVPLTAPPPAPR